ncbi:DEKNAAC102302 [Brettanomyces naardenensis]|uniref:DEKNAAC102302 n=1 Tax=Brettanomyces naardenensis TaxID=13370 RepID=A0A448YLN3_BRENA|nr:DEKNAAC102302 [Brettanomyces naardenensis]
MPDNYPIRNYPPGVLAGVPPDQRDLLPKPNSIPRRKYSTSIDPRNFLTVYEYQIGDHWVIWDYHSGLVHLTGLWKAVGNNKADIVKLVESSPELEKDLRRIRGGYLKIQGTWVPYSVAKTLASKFCYTIRYALIPVFGPEFVDMCLKPDEIGFGMLRMHVTEADMKRKRTRRRSSATRKVVGVNAKRATKIAPKKDARQVLSRHPLPQHQQQPQIAKYSPYHLPLSSSVSHILSPTSPSHYSLQYPEMTLPTLPKTDGLISVLRAAENLESYPLNRLSKSASASNVLHFPAYQPLVPATKFCRTSPISSPASSSSASLASSPPRSYNYVPISATRTTLPISPPYAGGIPLEGILRELPLPSNNVFMKKDGGQEIRRKMSIDGLVSSHRY